MENLWFFSGALFKKTFCGHFPARTWHISASKHWRNSSFTKASCQPVLVQKLRLDGVYLLLPICYSHCACSKTHTSWMYALHPFIAHVFLKSLLPTLGPGPFPLDHSLSNMCDAKLIALWHVSLRWTHPEGYGPGSHAGRKLFKNLTSWKEYQIKRSMIELVFSENPCTVCTLAVVCLGVNTVASGVWCHRR